MLTGRWYRRSFNVDRTDSVYKESLALVSRASGRPTAEAPWVCAVVEAVGETFRIKSGALGVASHLGVRQVPEITGMCLERTFGRLASNTRFTRSAGRVRFFAARVVFDFVLKGTVREL